MKHLVLIAFSIALLALPPPLPVSARTPELAEAFNGAEIAWRDIGSGIKEATKTGKPVVMVFHASWCSACKKYREVFKDAGVVAASREYVMILIDADKDKQANGAFSPDGTYVPRTLFLDAEGEVSPALVGKDPKYPHTLDIEKPDELLALMRKGSDVFARPPPSETLKTL